MDYLIICLTAFFISIITLFSGFGLGTVLMPIFALFFPLPLAIASTAIVHLLNNIFKVGLVGKLAKCEVVLRFAIPAALTSALGAYLLGKVSVYPPLHTYSFLNREFHVTIVGLLVGAIIMISSLFELIPRFSKLSFSSNYIPWGGALSGFFGGLSGNQGILRSAFLIKAGLTKEEFIGTGVVSGLVVDMVRVLIYGWTFYSEKWFSVASKDMQDLVIAATFSAILGSYIGTRLIKKVTFRVIQLIVGTLLLILGFGIFIGLI